MKKIKEFIKENYKLIIPFALMIVLFASFIIYYKVAVLNNVITTTEEKVYQYFYDEKYEYTASISRNKKDVITNVESIDIDINYDSTPIYYQEESIVIFHEDMSVVMPTLNCAEYLSLGYSYITYDKNYILTTTDYNDSLGTYFFYDGNDLYFFIEEVTLTVDDKEITLSPMSYVIARYGKYISYYDKDTDTYETITTSDNDSSITSTYYTVYISRDIIDYYGTDVILSNDFSYLNTIDMKD